MSENGESEMVGLILSDLYGGERFFADERRRIEIEFFKQRQKTYQKKGVKHASYADRLRARFEMKRKAK